MASNPASRRNSLSLADGGGGAWPVLPAQPPPLCPVTPLASPASPTSLASLASPPTPTQTPVRVYASPHPAPFAAPLSAFDVLLPPGPGVSPLPGYAACLPAVVPCNPPGAGGPVLTRGALRALALRLARGLAALGLRRGDTALIVPPVGTGGTPGGAEGGVGVAALLACLAAGVVAAPLHADVPLARQLDGGVSAVLLPRAALPAFEAANAARSVPVPDARVLLLDTAPPEAADAADGVAQRYRSVHDVLAPETPGCAPVATSPSDAALRLRTASGRALTLSHGALGAQLACAPLELGPGDVLLVPSPALAPALATLLPLALGAAVTFCSAAAPPSGPCGPSGGALVSALEASGATAAWLPAPSVRALASALRRRDGEARPLALRTVLCVGAPLPAAWARALPGHGVRVLAAYASAEAGLALVPDDGGDGTGGHGGAGEGGLLLAPGLQARLLAQDGRDARPDAHGRTTGHLCLRGLSVALPPPEDAEGPEGLEGPEGHAGRYLAGGWLATGDFASVRSGTGTGRWPRWTVRGRLDARFCPHPGGTAIGPERLEALLLRHAGVRDAAVARSPSPGGGVRAHLVLDPHPASAADADAARTALRVMRFVQGRTRKSRWVADAVLVQAVPRTSAGGVRRAALDANAAGGSVVRYDPARWAHM